MRQPGPALDPALHDRFPQSFEIAPASCLQPANHANKSERNIEEIRFRFYALRLRDAFIFQARVVAKIHEKTKFKSGCVQIVQELCAMLVGQRGNSFQFDDNFPEADVIWLVSLL